MAAQSCRWSVVNQVLTAHQRCDLDSFALLNFANRLNNQHHNAGVHGDQSSYCGLSWCQWNKVFAATTAVFVARPWQWWCLDQVDGWLVGGVG